MIKKVLSPIRSFCLQFCGADVQSMQSMRDYVVVEVDLRGLGWLGFHLCRSRERRVSTSQCESHIRFKTVGEIPYGLCSMDRKGSQDV